MLDATYEVLARKKRELRAQIDELSNIDKEIFAAQWIDKDFSPIKAVVGAEDGSYNLKKYKSFCLFVVNSCAILHNGTTREEKHADIGITRPYRYMDERVGRYMAIMELKTSLQIIDEVDVFLLDGSIISSMVVSRQIDRLLKDHEKKEAMELLSEVQDVQDLKVASRGFEDRFEGKKKNELITFLEYLEYLWCLKEFLERGKDKIVAISKTSTGTDYFNEDTSDLALFDMSTSRAGYSIPRPISIKEKIRTALPIYDSFFGDLDFTLFYARLEDRKPVYRFEVPTNLGEGEVAETLSKIKSVSIAGYPYLLKKAHNRVEIKNRDVKRIEKSLGIYAKKWRDF